MHTNRCREIHWQELSQSINVLVKAESSCWVLGWGVGGLQEGAVWSLEAKGSSSSLGVSDLCFLHQRVENGATARAG